MTGLHFDAPQWIHLLWMVLAFVIVTYLLERRAGTALSQFVAVSLQKRLVRRASATRRGLRLFFLALTGMFLILALMRPQWGIQFITTPRVGAEIMVCLDVSKSMLAEDVSPNRLDRAKAELLDLLTYLKGDQVGLIAFAGRASVLSPLTPDFGFLRLALDQAGIGSVTRGGTRLEEPIRKAIAGFGSSGDVSRSILLITDGEDQDSFPLEAAKDAAQRGIRILAIGFGDEAGSEITLTDKKTGVRSTLRDRDGHVVKSRLDGDLLREMAMLTEGAYIPAGTGVLDLESIFDRHIASLTRGQLDGRGRSVRNDAFQWAVLLGLLCLVAAVASTSASVPRGRGLGAWILVAGMLLMVAVPAVAEEQPAQAQTTLSPALAEQENPSPKEVTQTPPSIPADPRTAFNKGLEQFQQAAFDEAGRLLEAARSSAGLDGEVRFRATYNLGWVEVKRADVHLEKEPQKALQALHKAASWFREAISLRSGHEDTRHNLEIVLNRALVLADRLAAKDKKDLLGQLNKTIDAQRGFLDGLRSSLDLVDVQQDAHVANQARHTFRGLSARQLEVLSEGENLSKQAGQALESIRKKEEKERTPEDGVRSSQLEHLLHYLHRARERMGQARSRMRHLRAEQAFRRASAALTELKRGREQLLDPKTRLDALLADGVALTESTAVKAALNQGVPGLEPSATPLWLTVDYLLESQQAIKDRTSEFHQGIVAGLDRVGKEKQDDTPQDDAKQDKEPPSPELEKLVQQLKEAEPLIGQAATAFATAQTFLEGKKVADAMASQGEAVTKLAAARERFLDLKGLIQLAWRDENRIASFFKEEEPETKPAGEPKAKSVGEEPKTKSEGEPEAKSEGEPEAKPVGEPEANLVAEKEVKPDIIEYLPSALELQIINLSRGERIAGLIVADLDRAKEAAPEAAPEQVKKEEGGHGQTSSEDLSKEVDTDQEVLQQNLKRLKLADDLQTRMIRQMKTARLDLERLVNQTSSSVSQQEELKQARGHIADVQQTIEVLRQLFFSVVEHLKETIRRQTELNDATKEAAALAETRNQEETAKEVGPLVPRQKGLAQIAGSIGEALSKQADLLTKKTEPSEQTQATQAAQAEPLESAAKKVRVAQDKMNAAADKLSQTPTELPKVNDDQGDALEALHQALALLSPPEQQGHPKGDASSDQAQEKKSGGESTPQQAESNADPSQLLQGVRDREAKRREEQGRSRHGAYEPVERDW